MSFGLPPLNTLVAFEAAARLKSFVKAARELCITASAVSHRIKLLEQHYGTQFFIRNKESLSLTHEGAVFLEAVLDALLILRSASSRLRQDVPRTIRVNVSTALANKWLAHRLDGYYAKHRNARLEIRAVHHSALNQLADLRSGEVDLAIRYCRNDDWRGFRKTRLLPVRVFPVCSPAYKTRHNLRTPRDLANATLLRSPREPWDEWFRIAGLKNAPVPTGTEFSDAGLLLSAAIGGQGVALARDALVEEDIAVGRLVRLFEKSMPSELAYCALYPLKKTLRPEVKAFVAWLVGESRGRRS
ncbi:MAG TPA: LysR substrate-binding domain-containing protein [Burkholderiales bacterium]|nr:LysR substrate-binding domain-containing protein [Burkholderiales bacterium]